MADVKVRCEGCGAKNSDSLEDRCRICGALLPDSHARREAKVGASTNGPGFSELVETEVNAWREYAEARTRSRKPAEDSMSQKVALAGRALVLIVIAALAGAAVVYLAWMALIA